MEYFNILHTSTWHVSITASFVYNTRDDHLHQSSAVFASPLATTSMSRLQKDKNRTKSVLSVRPGLSGGRENNRAQTQMTVWSRTQRCASMLHRVRHDDCSVWKTFLPSWRRCPDQPFRSALRPAGGYLLMRHRPLTWSSTHRFLLVTCSNKVLHFWN